MEPEPGRDAAGRPVAPAPSPSPSAGPTRPPDVPPLLLPPSAAARGAPPGARRPPAQSPRQPAADDAASRGAPARPHATVSFTGLPAAREDLATAPSTTGVEPSSRSAPPATAQPLPMPEIVVAAGGATPGAAAAAAASAAEPRPSARLRSLSATSWRNAQAGDRTRPRTLSELDAAHREASAASAPTHQLAADALATPRSGERSSSSQASDQKKASSARVVNLEMGEFGASRDSLSADASGDLSPRSLDTSVDSVDISRPERPANFFAKANILSRLTFWWINRLIQRARRKRLSRADLVLNSAEEADRCYNTFRGHWDAELTAGREKRRPPSLLRALIRSFWRDYIVAAIFKLCWGALVILAAYYFVLQIVAFVSNYNTSAAEPAYRGWILAVFFFVTCFLLSVSLQQMTARASRVGIRVRAALSTAVFRKALVADGASAHGGQVVTLISTDCARLHEGTLNFHYLWSGPLESATIIGLIFAETGVAAVVGVIVAVLIVPVQYALAIAVTRLRDANADWTDKRVTVRAARCRLFRAACACRTSLICRRCRRRLQQIMHEILLAIKLVKFYSWEKPFAKQVARIRRKEVALLRKSAGIKTVHLMIVFILPPLMVLGIFSVYTLWMNQYLTATISFSVLSLFNTLRFPLVVLPVAMKSFSDMLSALQRISAFLQSPEIVPLARAGSSGPPGIYFRDATLGYRIGDKMVTALSGLTAEARSGQLLAICGSVGSGKTTCINALIGEAAVLGGSAEAAGSIAYVPQSAWIQHATVRDNILFGRPMNAERYRQVIFACALEADLQILEYGDMTKIGESGINLSGGQKQRISLARAAYADSDVYLLDTPLAAVDHQTCNHIFEHCIRGLLRQKAVLLITHNLHLLPECDHVVVLRDNRMIYSDPYTDTLVPTYFPRISEHVMDVKVEELTTRHAHRQQAPAVQAVESAIRPINEDETLGESNKRYMTTAQAFMAWFRQGTRAGFVLSFFVAAAAQVDRILSDLYVRTWSDNNVLWAQTPTVDRHSDQAQDAGTYAGYVGGFLVLLLLRGFSFYVVALRAATRLHNKMFRSVLRAPLAFFTLTPIGPLLNGFSRQQDQVDETLPDALHMGIIYFMILATSVGVIVAVLPYFAIVLVALIVFFFFLQWHYTSTATYLKLGVSSTNTAFLANVSETAQGIAIVRAFHAEQRFVSHNVELLNNSHAMLFYLEQLQCWIAFWMDLVASIAVLATALMCVGFQSSISAASAGLAISNALQLLVFLTFMVRSISEVRSQIVSVESISYFIRNTESERTEVNAVLDRSQMWPPMGRIQFCDVVMRYFPTSPAVLNRISFTIESREKIGIVGRTGSGKSSLLLALFRLVELSEGTILVDGQDISKLPLHDLRRSLSIIPQEPVMFKGTIRSNMDPFNEHSDEELWRAAELSHLKEDIMEMSQKLDTPVEENGGNMSLGQRQMFCLARAVLRNSRILVLDEATSALDLETDALIQQTIREVFFDRTVLTIAHRLATIMDYDKILVLDQGRVMEFDRREVLLANPNSYFSALVRG